MAFSDLDWASDANFPAGADSWSATPTRVAPSVGQQAAGVAPEDVLPAQWFNWLFGEIVDAGTTLETLVGAGTLQAAYVNSVAAGEASPHLDITGSFMRVGAPTPAVPMLVMDEASNNVFFGADLDVYTGKTVTLPSAAALLVTGAGASGVQSALTQTSGVGGEIALSAGAWTPAPATAAGAAATTDFSLLSGGYQRVGNEVFFTFQMAVDTTGWGGLGSVNVALPVAGTVSGVIRGPVTSVVTADFTALSAELNAAQLRILMTPSATTTGLVITGSCSYTLA